MKTRSAVTVDQIELEAVFGSRKAFLQAAAVHATECRLYWSAEEAHFTLNAPVRVILGFDGDAVRFTFRGTIIKVVDEGMRTRRTGAVIRITGEDQKAFGAAVSYARGVDPALGRRANPRISTTIPAQLGEGKSQQAVILDLSLGGAFAQLSGAPPPVGSLQPLNVGEQGVDVIPVRVCWIGPRDGKLGCGLEFMELGEKARDWLAKSLEAAEGE